MSDAIPRRLPEGNEFEITIDKIVYGGSGLGRFQGKVVFVPFTAVGDRVRVRVVREKKTYLEARVTQVIDSGPDRQEPFCSHFGTCGGVPVAASELFEPATVEATNPRRVVPSSVPGDGGTEDPHDGIP